MSSGLGRAFGPEMTKVGGRACLLEKDWVLLKHLEKESVRADRVTGQTMGGDCSNGLI